MSGRRIADVIAAALEARGMTATPNPTGDRIVVVDNFDDWSATIILSEVVER